MNSATNVLRLAISVLPPFQKAVQSEATRWKRSSRQRMFFLELQCELDTIQSQLLDLQVPYPKGKPNYLVEERKCRAAIEGILNVLESLCDIPETERNIEYQYPALHLMREWRISPVITYDLDSVDNVLDPLRDSSEDIGRILRRRYRTTAQSSEEEGGEFLGKTISICKLLRNVKQALDSQKLWKCKCTSPHRYMIFLSDYRASRESSKAVDFDFFLGTSREGSDYWAENRTCALLPAGFQLKMDIFEGARMSENELSSLCTGIRDIGTFSSLFTIFKGSQLFRAQDQPSQVRWLEAFPKDSLRDYISAGDLVSSSLRISWAIQLSYCVLYMTASAWLPPGWDSHSIRFLWSDQCRAHLSRPMLASQTPSPIVHRKAIDPRIYNRSDILQLGIILIEIFLGENLHSYCTRYDLAVSTDHETAARVAEHIDWDVYESYQAAVNGCLDIEQAIPDSGLDGCNAEYLQYITNKLIRPLEKELRALESKIRSIHPDVDSLEVKHEATARPASSSRLENSPNISAKESQDARSELVPYIARDNSNDIRVRRLGTNKIGMSLESTQKVRHRDTSKWPFNSISAMSKRRMSTGSLNFHTSIEKALIDEDVYNAPQVQNAQSSEVDHHAQSCAFSLFHDPDPSNNTQLLQGVDEWLNLFDSMIIGPRKESLGGLLSNHSGKVTVAILDSGIDSQNPVCMRHQHRIRYRDFITGDRQNPQDIVGHGTHTAAILLGVAKVSRIRVGRICSTRTNIDPKILAKAIDYAAYDWNADIICMPLGFVRRTKDLRCVQNAILRAHGRKVLMFAAAANCGGLDDVCYPANQHDVISVNSTDGRGNRSSFNPSPEGYNSISVPGEFIPSIWPVPESSQIPRKSGTSCAAPIASGIAAVIMEYIEQRKSGWSPEDQDVASNINSMNGMLAVMRQHMAPEKPRDGFHFLRPWKFFDDFSDFDTFDKLLLSTLRKS